MLTAIIRNLFLIWFPLRIHKMLFTGYFINQKATEEILIKAFYISNQLSISNKHSSPHTDILLASISGSKLVTRQDIQVFPKLVESVLNDFKTHKYGINK